jgi:hypothetical protein
MNHFDVDIQAIFLGELLVANIALNLSFTFMNSFKVVFLVAPCTKLFVTNTTLELFFVFVKYTHVFL